jgi:hypothetical protein
MDARRYFEHNKAALTNILGVQATVNLGKCLSEFLFEEALALLDRPK